MENNIIYTVIIATAIILWVYTIIEVFKSKILAKSKNILWLFFIIIVPIIGSLIYLRFGNKRRVKREFKPNFNH